MSEMIANLLSQGRSGLTLPYKLLMYVPAVLTLPEKKRCAPSLHAFIVPFFIR
jgi:hypothetical protein